LSDEYLLVTKTDKDIAFATSSLPFAEDIMSELQATIESWRKQEQARALRHHHDKPRPQKESSTESQHE
jgi:hypothetical protein